MKFRVDTIKGTYEFNNVKGLVVIPESRMIAVVNFNDDPIAQFNVPHIIAMGEVGEENGPEFANDVPESRILQPGSLKVSL